ncbi:MAG: hypothetical protein Q4F34_08930 [Prevotellaceae bacterium]|nr:hypothetical protein [Prevotellaceae bacterium]
MKRYDSNRNLFYAVLVAIVISVLTSSCYKIFNIIAPKEVVAGQKFDVTMTVVDNGDANQKEITDWSVAAIRVPEDWKVTCGVNSYRSYAEDWVYYSDGKPANSKYTMYYSESLSNAYNEAAPKSGYKWMAFVSSTKVTKYMAACWRNGCDSATVTFHVTAGTKLGKYTIDYLAGDDESEESPKSYSKASQLQGDGLRMFNASTNSFFSGKQTDNYAPSFASKITVVEDPSGINDVAAEEQLKGIYTIDGKKLPEGTNAKALPSGAYIINGKKTIVR